MKNAVIGDDQSTATRIADVIPFAKRLKEARTRAGLSQKELGIKAGIDAFSASPRINQYEKGKHVPDLATAQRLAAVLNVPAPFLYAKDDVMAQLILKIGDMGLQERRKLLDALESQRAKKVR